MSKLKQTKGFTLIELVIVLAIAALVLAAILLAVGGAQRSQRDNTTKNSASQVASALQNYASNNGGTMPAQFTALAASYLTNIKDGQGGTPAVAAAFPGTAAAGAGTEIKYSGNATCVNDNGSGGMQAGNSRQYAVDYYVENGKTDVCSDNT
jgi:prepilin-type N-terminal cleavage/methylation domain-containing protein